MPMILFKSLRHMFYSHSLLSAAYLRFLSIPPIIGSIDFVVSDDKLWAGTKVLHQINALIPCSDSKSCHASSAERYTPPPAFHMHIEASEVTVALYLQSKTFWFLPPLDSSLLNPKGCKMSSPFVLASDQTVIPPWRPGRGSGVFAANHDQVVVPKAHILLEAFLRLYACDSGKRIGSCAISMIACMGEYVDHDGLLDIELLPEPLRTSYKEPKEGKKPVCQWSKELKEALGVVVDEELDGLRDC